VARAFSGDPNGVAAILAEAIRHPGFAFVEVLSPCVTFRPEQRNWKQAVHPAPVEPTNDPAQAARRILTDDGFNVGILYRGDRCQRAVGGLGRSISKGLRCARCDRRAQERGEEARRAGARREAGDGRRAQHERADGLRVRAGDRSG
jgi:hypothetical protein